MESMVEMIVAGNTTFTPEVLVNLSVFYMVIACIGEIAYAVTSVGRQRR